MKKILFIMILSFMLLSCDKLENKSTKTNEQTREEEIYKSQGMEKVLVYLEEQAKIDTENKAYYYARIGYYYIEEEDYKNAEKMLNKAIDEDPNLGFAYNELAYIYSKNGNKEEALKYYLTGIEKDKSAGGNFLGAGSIYYGMKEYDKAIEYLEEAIQVYGKNKDMISLEKAYRTLFYVYYEQKDTDEIEKLLKRAVKQDIDKTFFYNQFAVLYYNQRDYDKGIKYSNIGIKYNPNYVENYYMAGLNYYAKGNMKEAEKNFEKTIPMYKNTESFDYLGDAYSVLHKIYTIEGNAAKAEEIEKKAVKDLGSENWEKKKL